MNKLIVDPNNYSIVSISNETSFEETETDKLCRHILGLFSDLKDLEIEIDVDKYNNFEACFRTEKINNKKRQYKYIINLRPFQDCFKKGSICRNSREIIEGLEIDELLRINSIDEKYKFKVYYLFYILHEIGHIKHFNINERYINKLKLADVSLDCSLRQTYYNANKKHSYTIYQYGLFESQANLFAFKYFTYIWNNVLKNTNFLNM